MIRDTSAQDRLVEVKPSRKRRVVLIGAGVAVVAVLALVLPQATRLFSADASVSGSRLAFGTVERGLFVRDIAAEGKVVAAVSPTLYATYGGAVTLKVHSGVEVKRLQALVTIDRPELMDKMWPPVEAVSNTPAPHRVHHGSAPEYLDKNYAGIFIIWDKLFGTFQPEKQRPTYGLTYKVETYNLLKLQYGMYGEIARDVRQAKGWRNKLGYIFGPPGWAPSEGSASD